MPSPIKDDPLGQAARYNDADCEEVGLIRTIEKQGLHFQMLLYMTKQRAVRSVFTVTRPGYLQSLPMNAPVPINLSPDEEIMMTHFVPAVMDAILLGWRARDIYDRAHGKKE